MAEAACPATTSDIAFARDGALGVITLTRPQALNALTLEMCAAIDAALACWQQDPAVAAVLIKGEGERAFCAGGDIRWMHDVLQTEGVAAANRFYAHEYRMNARLHHFRKPYVALMDGITMGGGVGVSVHGSHRVVTERTKFAMPETGIGLFPDVGATYVLPRLPGFVGRYLGLSGARLAAADCLWAGVASHFVPAAALDALQAALAGLPAESDGFAAVGAILDQFKRDPGPARLTNMVDRIEFCLSPSSWRQARACLAAEATGWGSRFLTELKQKSPTSLAVTYRQLEEGRMLDFDAAIRLEYRLVQRFMAGHDFREGVRALLIDKDKQPRWRPAAIEDVDDPLVDSYFAPLATADELPLPDWQAVAPAAAAGGDGTGGGR